MKLHLHVKTIYFNAIKDGSKLFEFRLVNDHWEKRIVDRQYDGIVIYNAYRPGAENRLELPWLGSEVQTITHPHFGPDPVRVFAIRCDISEILKADLLQHTFDQTMRDLENP